MLTHTQFQNLAKQFMGNAVKAAKGDNIWVEYQGEVGKILADACADYLKSIDAIPFVIDAGSGVLGELFDKAKNSNDRHAYFQNEGQILLEKMKDMQGYIRICDRHDTERANFNPDDMMDYRKLMMKYGACMADYSLMGEAVKPLEALMTSGKHVRITGKETDISFSIECIPAKECTGEFNIPDGECFTAPVKDSVNGHILYGPSSYLGIHFPWIKLECEHGRVVDAKSEGDDLTKKLNDILDTDPGARYFGEFAIGFNPMVTKPVGSILFDEKIAGSFHLTPGQCYEDIAPNGNVSAVHWDMVKIQRPDFGGGDIYIDDELIRRDGIFVREDLKGLNPENLLKTS